MTIEYRLPSAQLQLGREHYIGDGVYASFDGCGIKIKTQRENGEHYIILEPEVFMQLIGYGKTIWRFGDEKTSR